eukprot:jgi/Phyca11/120043/e_gw1.40.409.1
MDHAAKYEIPTTRSPKEGPVRYCCKKLKSDEGNDQPRQFNRSMVQGVNNFGAKILLDCGATTVYVSRGFVKKHELKTHAYTDRTIRVKLGDNKIGKSILELVKIEILLQGVPNYQCIAVVFDIPEEFDFVDVHPDIDWKNRCFKVCVSDGTSTAGSAVRLMAPGFTMLWVANALPR